MSQCVPQLLEEQPGSEPRLAWNVSSVDRRASCETKLAYGVGVPQNHLLLMMQAYIVALASLLLVMCRSSTVARAFFGSRLMRKKA